MQRKSRVFVNRKLNESFELKLLNTALCGYSRDWYSLHEKLMTIISSRVV